jgi:hypothetical protein
MDRDEPVHCVEKLGVHAEREKLAAELEVFADQRGQAFLIAFDRHHATRERPEFLVQSGDIEARRLDRMPGVHGCGERMTVAALTESGGDELPRFLGVGGRYTDGSKQGPIPRPRRQQPADTPPEQGENVAGTLELGADEGAAELQRGTELVQQRLAVDEQAVCIEAAQTALPDRHVRHGQAVRSQDLAPPVIPDEQLLIPVVVSVPIASPSGALAHRAEAELTQATDLRHQAWDLRGRSHGHHAVTALVESLERGQRRELQRQQLRRLRWSDRLRAARAR